MPTRTQPQPSNLDELRDEITVIRSFVIGLAGRDPEGNYRPEFVERILKASREKATKEFKSAESFLDDLK